MMLALAAGSRRYGDVAADLLLRAYQRYLSPYKGYACACRVGTGRRSCSAYARAIVRRLGVAALPAAMPRQFARCRAAHAALGAARDTVPVGPPPPPARRGRGGERPRREPWWKNPDCSCCCTDLPCSVGRAKSDLGACDCLPCDGP